MAQDNKHNFSVNAVECLLKVNECYMYGQLYSHGTLDYSPESMDLLSTIPSPTESSLVITELWVSLIVDPI